MNKNRLFVSSILLTSIAIVLCFVPLFNILDYEFSLVLTVSGAPIALWYGIGFCNHDHNRENLYWWQLIGFVLSGLLLLLGPLLVISINAIWVQNCNYLRGLSFLLVLPGISFLYAIALGNVIGRVSYNAFMRILFVLVSFSFILFFIGKRLYLQPQIVVFDHLFGYFAGSIYDENISISPDLLLYRIITIFHIVCFLSVSMLIFRYRRSILVASSLIVSSVSFVALIVIYLLMPTTLFNITRDDITHKYLKQFTVADHVILYAPLKSEAKEIELFSYELLFQLRDLQQNLSIKEISTPITVYVYENQEQKNRLIGAKQTVMSRPWQSEIHMHGLHVPHSSLRHELVHVLMAPYNSSLLRLPCYYKVFPILGIVEGIASALEIPSGILDVHYKAKFLLEQNKRFTLQQLHSLRFWMGNSKHVYGMSGSFFRYLLDSYGPQAIKELYGNADYQQSFHKSLLLLENDWRQYLQKLPIPSEIEKRVIDDFSQQKSVFHKICAHEIAAKRQQLALIKSPQRRIKYIEEINTLLGTPVREQINLMQAFVQADKWDQAVHLALSLLDVKNIRSSQQAVIYDVLGQEAYNHNDYEKAQTYFEKALSLSSHSGFRRLQAVRIWCLKYLSHSQLPFLMSFLAGKEKPRGAVLRIKSMIDTNAPFSILKYLLGRQLYLERNWKHSLEYLHEELQLPSNELQIELMRMIVTIYYNLSEYSQCDHAANIWQGLAQTNAERERASHWQNRCKSYQYLHAEIKDETIQH